MIKHFFYVMVFLFLIIGKGCYNKSTIENKHQSHIQTTQEIKIIMHKFNNLIYEHFQSELDRDEKRIEYTKSMIPLIDELVKNSQQLQKIKYQSLTPKKQEIFLKFAKKLESKSKQLKKMVITYQPEAIAQTLNEIDITCTQCHATIR